MERVHQACPNAPEPAGEAVDTAANRAGEDAAGERRATAAQCGRSIALPSERQSNSCAKCETVVMCVTYNDTNDATIGGELVVHGREYSSGLAKPPTLEKPKEYRQTTVAPLPSETYGAVEVHTNIDV